MGLKIILRKKYKADGTSPLALRITKDRKTSFVYLGHHILEKDWDSTNQRVKKSHPNSVRLNNLILSKLNEASGKAIAAETVKDSVSSIALKQTIQRSRALSFFTVAGEYLQFLERAGKYNEYTADKSKLKRFAEFASPALVFSDITPSLLERSKTYLTAKCGLSERTAINHWAVIRSVFAYAAKHYELDKKMSPFGKGGIVIKFPDSKKIGLSQADVEALEGLELPEPHHDHARNLWLVSFYFAGMRVSDLLSLKWSDFQDGHVYYTMRKNGKPGSLIVSERAWDIIGKYAEGKRNDGDYVFPDLKDLQYGGLKRHKDIPEEFYIERQIAFTTSRIDKILRKYVAPQAGIAKPVTMHIARHTFGNISGDRISIQLLQQFYRHSSPITTINYQQNFIKEKADQGLLSVIDFARSNGKADAPVMEKQADGIIELESGMTDEQRKELQLFKAFRALLDQANAPAVPVLSVTA